MRHAVRRFAVLALLAASCAAVPRAGEGAPEENPVRTLSKADRRIDPKKRGFKLTFSDEFDGNALNAGVWQVPLHVRHGTSRWLPEHVAVRDGKLRIEIVKTDDPTIRYHTAGIRTTKSYNLDKDAAFKQAYGYWEIRARLPKHLDTDYWAAFWIMPADVNDGDTRVGAEIDIMESFRFFDRGRSAHALHWGGYGDRHNSDGPTSGHHPQLADGKMHTYGLYWDEDLYAFLVDGYVVAVTDAVGLGKEKADKDPKLSVSQGTMRNPGFPKITVEANPMAGPHWDRWEDNMPKRDVFEVDYIRVYEGKMPEKTKRQWLRHNYPEPRQPDAKKSK